MKYNDGSRKIYKKQIISGNVIEQYEYEHGVRIGESKKEGTGGARGPSEAESIVNRERAFRRAEQTLRRTINANIDAWSKSPKFVTLTFAENIQNVKQANYLWTKFRKRLEYKLKFKLKYAVVIEFQKRGAIHYHAIFFNLPYIKKGDLAKTWGNGFIKVNELKDVDNVGAYVTKYMTKEQQDEIRADRLQGEKSYFCSKGLKKPQELTDDKKIDQVTAGLKEYETYSTSFDNDYLGNINYTQYKLKR